MKSGRYGVLPRVRFRHGIDESPWMCTWKDPGKLIQSTGKPLRYVAAYVGYGETMNEAINECRDQYVMDLLRRRRMDDAFDAIMMRVGDGRQESTLHCVDTSNLPWWRRLFRV
jgi:hypothetical protein